MVTIREHAQPCSKGDAGAGMSGNTQLFAGPSLATVAACKFLSEVREGAGPFAAPSPVQPGPPLVRREREATPRGGYPAMLAGAPPRIVKYTASGWWRTIAEVDCSGTIWQALVRETPMARSGSSSFQSSR